MSVSDFIEVAQKAGWKQEEMKTKELKAPKILIFSSSFFFLRIKMTRSSDIKKEIKYKNTIPISPQWTFTFSLSVLSPDPT